MAFCELALILLLHIHEVASYGAGAPMSTCFTQYPKHKTATQTGPSPFNVTFSPSSYRPGQDVTIHVMDKTGMEFVGLQMAARRMTGNTEEIVGRFVDYPTDKTKVFNCFGGYQNMVTHVNNDPVKELTFRWRPPSDNVGDVTFISTFVRSFKIFWHKTKSNLAVDSSAPQEPPKYPAIPLKVQTKSINFDDCGNSKGCFYYPRSCSGSDCKAVATYIHRESTKEFVFELYLNENDAKWVSIGFSDDEWMGNDVTISCTSGVGLMSVQEGFNPGYYNERKFSLYSSSHEIMYKDGKIQCRFVVPEIILEYSIDQAVSDAFRFRNKQWDLMKDWYLFLAWGNTMPDSKTITYHSDLPAVSAEKVDLTEKVITFTSTFHIMVQVHATLMVIAWIPLAGIVTVISRHYRDWMAKSKLCGSPLWFQIHRCFAVLVVALTLAGIIVIFVHYGIDIRDMAIPHAYVGLATVGCVALQLICGMLRPGLENSLRPLFNVGHRFTGHASHILAAVTMFLAYDIDYINSDMQLFGFIVLGVWVGVQLFWHLIFEIIKRHRAKSDGSNSYNMDDINLKPDSNVRRSDDCPHTTTLITYVLTLMGVCAAAIVPLYMY